MIEASAVVVSLEGERVRVKLGDRPGGCGRCDELGGCRSARLAYAFGTPKEEFVLPNPVGARVGDRVVIQLREGSALRGALLSYGLGACLLLAGAAAGHALAAAGREDGIALIGAVLGLATTLVINRLLHRSRNWRASFAMQMLRLDTACSAGPSGGVS